VSAANKSNTAAIWRDTLERLKTTPIDAVSKAWLQSAYLTSTPDIGADDIDASSEIRDRMEIRLKTKQ